MPPTAPRPSSPSRLGRCATAPVADQLRPLSQLDVELWRDGKRLGLLAQLRDVLPGRYAFGLTGRGPRGGPLARGPYRLRVVARPPDGLVEAKSVGFRIR